jgi:penicillin-insensitive murein DD-endopeptidase
VTTRSGGALLPGPRGVFGPGVSADLRAGGGGRNNVGVRRPLLAVIASLALASGGCVELGVVGDGTSVSWGPANEGVLLGGTRLPLRGEGFVVHDTWSARDSQWGIDELLAVVVWTGRVVARAHPGSELAVGDLSIGGGGPSAYHRSHQTGRDVDLLLFGRSKGRPLPSTAMQAYTEDGVLADDPTIEFDVERNWTVVRALLTAPGPGVANIFLYAPLRDRLLDHARDLGEPEWLIDLAAAVVSQPSDSAPHHDHLHVRIYCPPGEPTCRDYALRPAAKKPPPPGRFDAVAATVARRPIVGGLLRFSPRW